jgi:hypothetical protein
VSPGAAGRDHLEEGDGTMATFTDWMRLGEARMTSLATLALGAAMACIAPESADAAHPATGERSVSGVRISLGEEGRRWTLVPTLLDGKVESFLALREDLAYGENLTAVWYRKVAAADGTESWETKAFEEQDQPKAIRAVKEALALADSTDESWPVAVAPIAAAAPEPMIKGVLESDALAPLVAELEDPQPIVEMLEEVGWATAAIDASLELGGCTAQAALSDLAARAEAELVRQQQGLNGVLHSTDGLPCGVSVSTTRRLGTDGTWTVPDLTSLLPQLASQELSQSPSAGSTVRGSSTVLVEFRSTTAGAVGERKGQVIVHLRDTTPPEVSVDVTSSGTVYHPRSRLPYIVAPATFTLRASASDRGEPIAVTSVTGGTEVTVSDIGLHVVRFSATDASGISTEHTELLEIRDRPLFDAELVVESLAIEPTAEGRSLLTATVLLGATEFDSRLIHFGAAQLRVLSAGGELLAAPASVVGMSLCESACPGGGSGPGVVGFEFDPDQNGAEFQHGYWRLRYQVELSPNAAAPALLQVDGMSKEPTSEGFDFVGETVASATVDAVAHLAILGAVHPDVISGGSDPTVGEPCVVVPPVQCRWMKSLTRMVGNGTAWCLNTKECGLGLFENWIEIASIRMKDPLAKPWGYGEAAALDCVGSIACSRSTGTGGVFKMWLAPTPPCTSCTMTTTAFPTFVAAAGSDYPALGLAGAQITVEGGGVTAEAVGAVASGSNPPITVTVGLNSSVPVTIISGQPSQRTFNCGAPKVGVVNACTVHVGVGSNGYIDVWADNHWVWNFGSSWASIGTASPNLSIHGQVIAGPCAGLTDELKYE